MIKKHSIQNRWCQDVHPLATNSAEDRLLACSLFEASRYVIMCLQRWWLWNSGLCHNHRCGATHVWRNYEELITWYHLITFKSPWDLASIAAGGLAPKNILYIEGCQNTGSQWVNKLFIFFFWLKGTGISPSKSPLWNQVFRQGPISTYFGISLDQKRQNHFPATFRNSVWSEFRLLEWSWGIRMSFV